jgi:hypothetical protein
MPPRLDQLSLRELEALEQSPDLFAAEAAREARTMPYSAPSRAALAHLRDLDAEAARSKYKDRAANEAALAAFFAVTHSDTCGLLEVGLVTDRGRFAQFCDADAEGFLDAAWAALEADADGRSGETVRWTPNPIGKVRLAAKQAARGTVDVVSDSSLVLARRWFILEVDPRKAEAHTAATQAEKAAMVAAVRPALETLARMGFPEPLTLDSGNGHAYLYRANRPNDEFWGRTFRRAVAALAHEHKLGPGDGSAAILDPSQMTPAGGLRCPYTRNRKGPGTKERPWRVARVLAVPIEVDVIGHGLIEALAARLPEPKRTPFAWQPKQLDAKELPAYEQFAENRAMELLEKWCEELAEVRDDRHDAFLRGATKVAGLAKTGHLPLDEVRAAFEAAAISAQLHRSDQAGPNEHAAEASRLLDGQLERADLEPYAMLGAWRRHEDTARFKSLTRRREVRIPTTRSARNGRDR